MIPPWQLQNPIDAIIFDCDGTLSAIEGIDELAKWNGANDAVKTLTAKAMNITGINPELYRKRLELTRPTQQQVIQLGQHYFAKQIPHIHSIIQIFSRLKKPIFIISAGLRPAVVKLGELLGIPSQHIFAVDIFFDKKGNYFNFEDTSLLTHQYGKKDIIATLKTKYPRLIFVGDGLNDLPAFEIVTRSIGYGGSFYREMIADHCDYYIKTMTALLPLSLTEKEYQQLTASEKIIYHQGVEVIST